MIQLAQSAKRAYAALGGDLPEERPQASFEESILGFSLAPERPSSDGGDGGSTSGEGESDDEDEEVEIEVLEEARRGAIRRSQSSDLARALDSLDATSWLPPGAPPKPLAAAPAPPPAPAAHAPRPRRPSGDSAPRKRRRTPTNTTPRRSSFDRTAPRARDRRRGDARRRARMLADFASADRTPTAPATTAEAPDADAAGDADADAPPPALAAN